MPTRFYQSANSPAAHFGAPPSFRPLPFQGSCRRLGFPESLCYFQIDPETGARSEVVRLSVNVNKIALLRNSRGGNIPDVIRAARTCIAAGCHGITVHPRPDARHITTDDVLNLAEILTVEFNIEGYPSPAFLALVERVRPTQATLVPDPPNVLTSNAGWDLTGDTRSLRDIIARLRIARVRTSLFIEPNPIQVEHARDLGADRVELFTGPYARSFGTPECAEILQHHRDSARLARRIGLGVNAGHDLDLKNIPDYVRTVKGLQETSIGHAIVNDALYIGLTRIVKAYLKALGSKPAKQRPNPRPLPYEGRGVKKTSSKG